MGGFMTKKRTNHTRRDGNLIDAVAEIVHQGCGRLLNASEMRASLDGWRLNCSMNYEYVFVWKPSFDLSSLNINWKRPLLGILRKVVKDVIRVEQIKSGSPMTRVEQQEYRLELARQKHGYQSAEECLESETDVQWVDLSYVTDSQGRDVYILEMADAITTKDDDLESIIERHQEIWNWKSQPLTLAGPFASSEEAEEWMAANGAFEEVD